MRSRVGLGTFPFSNVFTKVTNKQTDEIVKAFFDQGGYYLDTAPIYGFGKVEKILGRVLKTIPRKNYFLMTKCGWIGIETRKPAVSNKRKDVIRECDRSLKRLRVDYIDLYFVHLTDPDTPLKETVEALIDLKKSGKIKKIGVSNVSLCELEEYLKYGKIEFIQNRFSTINRSLDADFSQFLIKKKIGLIPYQVIERGLLTDKVAKKYRLRPGDLRHQKPEWQAEVANEIADWTNSLLRPIAHQMGMDPENLAISWMLSKPYVSFVIVGATNVDQLQTNMASNEFKLPKKVIKQIDQSYQDFEMDIRRRYKKEVWRFMGLEDKFYQPSIAPGD